ncbi:Gfo/Idh/MocA family protein [Thalassospira australica]|uniref:Gfo/Idh/MocA family protein n=1 Tax=Thalassospira australica TaxID=1528106 RepID=UPI00051A3E91|nr:Gfo/Idh/MocA family oxidoreductase [Thalassospira australica]
MKKFALIGAAGYVAPRHMKAIKEVEGSLAAAFDPSDSVGAIDGYFPNARFFTEFERFDRHVDVLFRSGNGVDYISVCSPNYLHDAHARFGLRSGADVICEKPLVLNPWNLDGLQNMQEHTGKRLYTILQLRLHPAIVALKKRVEAVSDDHVFDVDLSYITSRGAWYFVSWKGDEAKSGGIATNIGVHFYDMLSFVFGDLKEHHLHLRTSDHAAGFLEFKRARVRWFLSVNRNHLPPHASTDQTTYRSITVDGDEIEFSGGFTDLHTLSYQHILNGEGFGVDEVRPSIELVSSIRSCNLEPEKGDMHPFAREIF